MMSGNITEMPVPPRPFTKILLGKDNTEFKILVTFNGIAEIEEMTGKSVMDRKLWDEDISDPEIVRKMLYVCLKPSSPDLKETEVGGMLHMGNLAYVMGKITDAWKISSGEKGSKDLLPLEILQAA
jgi:hypothetical protein